MSALRDAAQRALAWIHYHRRTYGIDEPVEELKLRDALAQEEKHRPGCALLQIPSRDCDCRPEAPPTRAQQMRDAGYTRRPTLREMAQREQEPVAPYAWMAVGGTIWRRKTSEDDVPLYTAPPRREWQGLSEEEMEELLPLYSEPSIDAEMLEFAVAIESKLKEKNHE